MIAIYAAIVGSGALGWQVFQWSHARRVRLVVTARRAAIGFGPDNIPPVVAISAVNNSDFQVNIAAAGTDMQDGSGGTLNMMPMPGATIPGVVAPHDSATAFLRQDSAEEAGLDLYQPVRAWVRLSTGQTIYSDAEPLLRR